MRIIIVLICCVGLSTQEECSHFEQISTLQFNGTSIKFGQLFELASHKYDELIKHGGKENDSNVMQAKRERAEILRKAFQEFKTTHQKNDEFNEGYDCGKKLLGELGNLMINVGFTIDSICCVSIVSHVIKGIGFAYSLASLIIPEDSEVTKIRQEIKEYVNNLRVGLQTGFQQISENLAKLDTEIGQRISDFKILMATTNYEQNVQTKIGVLWKQLHSFLLSVKKSEKPEDFSALCVQHALVEKLCKSISNKPIKILWEIQRQIESNVFSTLSRLKNEFSPLFQFGKIMSFVAVVARDASQLALSADLCHGITADGDIFSDANGVFYKHIKQITEQLDNFTSNLKNEALDTIKSDKVCKHLLENQVNQSEIVDSNKDAPLIWLQAHFPWYRWYRFSSQYFDKERPEHYHTNYLLNLGYSDGVKNAFQKLLNSSEKNAGPRVINWSQNSCSYVQKIHRGETKNVNDMFSYKRTHFIGLYQDNKCGMEKLKPSAHDIKNHFEMVPHEEELFLPMQWHQEALVILIFLPMPNCSDGSCLEYLGRRGYSKGIKWNDARLKLAKEIMAQIYNNSYTYRSFLVKKPGKDRNWLDYLGSTDKNMRCVVKKDIMHGPQIGENNTFSIFYTAVEKVDFSYFGKTVTDTLETTLLCDVDSCIEYLGPVNTTMKNAFIDHKERAACLQKFHILEGCF